MNTSKLEIPWIKEDIGLGTIVQRLVDPQHRYANCLRCRQREQALNALLTFVAPKPPVQPQRPHNVPIERPPTDKEV